MCFTNSLALAFSDSGLWRLVSFQVPNFMSIFRCVVRSRGSVCQKTCIPVHNILFFLQRGVNYSLARSLSWITPCRLSVTAHSVYAQPPSVCGTHLLRLQLEGAPCAGNRDTHFMAFCPMLPDNPIRASLAWRFPRCRPHVLVIKECCYGEGGYGALMEWYWQGKTKCPEENLF